LLKADNYPLPPAMESAFSNSQVAVFEVDIDKAEDPSSQAAMLSKIRLPEGETLQQNLSVKVYGSFTNHANQAGIPMAVFEQFKPAMAVEVLEMMELGAMGVDPEYGLDKHFFKLAHDSHKQIVPLETAEFQIDLMTGF